MQTKLVVVDRCGTTITPNRNWEDLVSGRNSKKESKARDEGLLHKIPEKLQRSAIATGKVLFEKTQQQYRERVERQQAAKAKKKQDQYEAKCVSARRALKNASWLHQQYRSLRCWDTKKSIGRIWKVAF